MKNASHHIAQIAISRAKAPLDQPIMQPFVEQLQFINEVADRSPGFIWRLQSDEGNATAFRAFKDPLILLNMSVWESIETLFDYVYKSAHVVPFRNRRQWFEKVEGSPLVLWWVPVGHRPTIEEAKERLDLLNAEGPSPTAFTFRKRFPPPTLAETEDGESYGSRVAVKSS
ncbi:MAG: DUF3291 domain-containing protein [Proteobacteria bacterium]|nr:DUF3291 domain-containing protein [Pseudomonadota bacterium]